MVEGLGGQVDYFALPAWREFAVSGVDNPPSKVTDGVRTIFVDAPWGRGCPLDSRLS